MEKHHGFQYVDGLNVLTDKFSYNGSCVPGGLYFTDTKNILNFLTYGIYLREIKLPHDDKDFKIVKDGNKWRANKIILGQRYNLSDVATIKMLLENGARKEFIELFYWSYTNNYSKIIDWLFNVNTLDFFYKKNLINDFKEIVKWGFINDNDDVIEWICINHISKIYDSTYAIMWCCKRYNPVVKTKKHEIIKELCTNSKYNKTIIMQIFIESCSNKNFETAKWIFSRYNIYFLEKKYLYSALIKSRKKNNDDISNWILTLI